MQEFNVNDIRFRCSSLGHIMTNSRTGGLSETAKTHAIDCFVSYKYGRQTNISNKYIEKGLAVEEDSITLLSRLDKCFYKKNEDRITNQFISGTPDLYVGDSIAEAELIIDTKSSWDLFTFHRTRAKSLNKLYYWQLQGYMALTGANKARLAYCLVNTPEIQIIDEQRKLFYRMNALTEDNQDYIDACAELEKSMIYDDIPLNERVHVIEVDRNEDDILSIYSRVVECREYIQAINDGLVYEPAEMVL